MRILPRRPKLLSTLLLASMLTSTERASAAATVVAPRRIDTQGDVPYPTNGSGEAKVLLIVLISAEGAVADVTVKRGEAPFSDAAIAAVKTWVFTPTTRDDVPVAARIAVEVAFHPPEPSPPPAPSQRTTTPGAATSAVRSGATPPPPEEHLVVSVRGEREEPGTNHIPRSDLRYMPGAFSDPFRAVEALPGVAPWLSGLPYFYVRGTPPESVGYALDGIPVPLLFHVGSGPSTISPALVDSVDLWSGTPPSRYGRFAGAMITGETTRPNMDETHAFASARAFDANAFVETPFDGGQGSAMAAGRFGYTGFLSKLVAPDYGIGYWDYQARAAHKTWGDDVATIFAFGARDDLDYRGQKFFHVEYHRLDARYDHPTKDGNLRAAITFSADDSFTAEQNTSGVGNNAALSGPGARARVEWDRRLGEGARLRAGGDVGLRRFTRDDTPTFVRPHHTDVESGLYADVVWRPIRRVEVVPGFRLDMYDTPSGTRVAPQPRTSARVSITPKLAWVSSFGVTHQEPSEQVYVPAKLPDPAELAAREGYHLEEGVEARLGWRVRLHATAFYTRISAASVTTNERAYGGELFVRRDLSERLGGFLAYTISRADLLSGGATTRASWDRTHLFSMALSYDLGGGFRAGARLYAETGRPYYATCNGPSCNTLPPGTATPTGTLPGFFRLDARVEKKWSFDRGRYLTLSVECFNATNNAEPVGATFTPGLGVTTDTQSPVILPSVGIEAGF